MDRIRKAAEASGLLALLAFVGLLLGAGEAASQSRPRMVYNPVTKQTEPEQLGRQAPQSRPAQPKRVRQASVAPAPQQPVRQTAMHQEYLEPAGHLADCGCADCCGGVTGCGDLVGCGVGVDCGATACGSGVCPPALFYTGFEFTFVKPRFENNVAFTTLQTNGAGDDVLSETEFDYDLELTPRVFVGWKHADGVGLRATWWHFDNGAAPISVSPPANGLGRITPPAFADIDLSSNVPGDVFTMSSHLNAYTIDLEAIHESCFCGWDLGVAGGIRYAFAEQGYLAEVESDNGAAGRVIDGRISYLQSIEGIGPTISLSASRQLTQRASLFCNARGSLLFGDGESRLSGEEEALTAGGFTFTTDRTTNRDDVLSIAQMQLGFRWQGGQPCYTFRPFLTMAMEGQVWNGAGNATSEDGTLGFFGFATQVGFEW